MAVFIFFIRVPAAKPSVTEFEGRGIQPRSVPSTVMNGFYKLVQFGSFGITEWAGLLVLPTRVDVHNLPGTAGGGHNDICLTSHFGVFLW